MGSEADKRGRDLKLFVKQDEGCREMGHCQSREWDQGRALKAGSNKEKHFTPTNTGLRIGCAQAKKSAAGQGGMRQVSRDHGRVGWAAGEVAPVVRSQLCGRTNQTCFGCRYN